MSNNYALVDVNEIESKVLKTQKTKYLKEQVENIMKKIEKLNGKIAVKRSNLSSIARNMIDDEGSNNNPVVARKPNSIEIGSKMTSQQLHVKGMMEEKVLLEESLAKCLLDIEQLQNDLPVEEPDESRREYLIRTGRLNPLEKKEVKDDELIAIQDPSEDVFLRDAQGLHNDYQDDGIEDYYRRRYNKWALAKYASRTGSDDIPSLADIQSEEYQPLKEDYDVQLTHDLIVPGEIYNHLFEYQKTCLKWLYELNVQNVGGVLGDEVCVLRL
jgi:DNA excision repair protein ERCC-6